MLKRENSKYIGTAVSIIVILLLAAASVVFGVLFVNVTEISFLSERKTLFIVLLNVIISALTVIAVVFQLTDKKFVYKAVFLFFACSSVFLLVIYLLKISGLSDKIDSIEDLRAFVSGYGSFMIPIFIAIQFLQVVILPIPGFITIGAGVALFGPFYGSLYSIIGILSASLVAFFIGRFLGYKVASWLVGKETLAKWTEAVKGKDKIVLTFMFLFPFFPDDVLCFVAGLSSMSVPYYFVMITITRIINIVVSSYSIEGTLIPYNTWWGITIWAALFVITLLICRYMYKYGDKIEGALKRFFTRKRKADGKNHTSRRP